MLLRFVVITLSISCFWALCEAKDLRDFAGPEPQIYGGKGLWSEWTDWSPCSVTCGPGEKGRTRSCSPETGYDCPGPSTQTDLCRMPQCALWRDWAGWTSCSASCGEGTRMRSRMCSSYIGCHGQRTESEACFGHSCPEWTAWEEWGACSKMCGGGQRLRLRDCTVPGQCIGHDTESTDCNMHSCCTEWSEWSQCSVTCIGVGYTAGVEKRSRRCTVDMPQGGRSFPGSFGRGFGYSSKEESESRPCKHHLPPCAVWSQWGQWCDCSSTCGGGERTRERTCSLEGSCAGVRQQAERCNNQPCPEWLPWSNWRACDASCGGGQKQRNRLCSQPGLCLGDHVDSSTCNDFPCPEWSEWAPWSPCSESCDGGFQIRNRVCNQAEGCPGDSKEKRLCNIHQCPQFDQWSSWQSCTAECGGGVRIKSRPCLMDNKFCQNDQMSSRSCQCDGPVESFESCNTHACPLWSQWGDWNHCSHPCGGGTKLRKKSCIIDEHFCMGNNLGLPSCKCDGETGERTETADCNSHICPHWSPWQPWGACSASCGGGGRERSRICIRDELYCAEAPSGDPSCVCEGSSQSREQCNAHLCPVWDQWTRWSECSAVCDGGKKEKSRVCQIDAGFCSTERPDSRSCNCEGSDFEEADCNTHYCARWKKWEDWSDCSAPCDGGMQERRRQCDIDISWCVGSKLITDISCQCVGNDTDSQRCNQHFCPQYDAWSAWESCSVTCGGGIRQRIRPCNIPADYCIGDMVVKDPISCQCRGDFEEFHECNTYNCPFWAAWVQWSQCSVTCGIGNKDRKRKCDVDPYHCVGEVLLNPECQCQGEDVEAKQCEEGPCFAWSSWSSWSNCSQVCGGGSRNRARECEVPGACPGLGKETGFCNQIPCPDWGSWSEWSSCSVSCGGGQRARTRSCALKGGCSPGGPYEAEPCNENSCPMWSEWGSWGMCSRTCGEGSRERARTCDIPDGCFGHVKDIEPCLDRPCELLTHWSAWSPCSLTCGGGVKTRSRVSCPTCAPEDEKAPCEEQPCPLWSTWNPWTTCSKTCGGGQRTRDRICADSASGTEVPRGCVGKKVEVDPVPCSAQPCVSW